MKQNLLKKRGKNSFIKNITISSSVLAGLFALSTITNNTQAAESDSLVQEVRNLQDAYENIDNSEVAASTDQSASEENANEVEQVSAEQEEQELIKTQLIQAIQRAGHQDIIDSLQLAQISADELEQVFDAVIEAQLSKEQEDETVNEEQDTQVNDESETPVNEELQAQTSETQETATSAVDEQTEEETEQQEQNDESLNSQDETVSNEQEIPDGEDNQTEDIHNTENDQESEEDLHNINENTTEDNASTTQDIENSESVTSEETVTEEDTEVTESTPEVSENAVEDEESANEEDASNEENSNNDDSEVENTEEESNDEVSNEENEEQEEQTAAPMMFSTMSATASTLSAEATPENVDEAEIDEPEISSTIPEETADSEIAESQEETVDELEEELTEENPEEQSEERTSSTYVVKSGDTINKIASANNVSVDSIVSLNGLSNPNQIFTGQYLQIPSSSTATGKETEQITNPDSDRPAVVTSNSFINTIGPEASLVAAEHNLYASVMIAQASLESGYGGSSLSSPPNHNLFGIKGNYQGQTVYMPTREWYASTGWITVNEPFRKYPNYAASFRDNARLLRNGLTWDPYYYSGTWKENTNSYRDATNWLQGRYATDPTYANKLNRIVDTFGLTRYDNGVTAPVVPSSGSNQGSGSTYTVRYGDTLSRIASRFGTSVSNLKSLNGLTSDLIVTGQTLRVSGTSSSNDSSNNDSGNNNSGSNNDQSNQGSTSTYTVQSGDTLSRIANRFGTSVNSLKSLNGLSSDLIITGQTLQVSGSTGSNGSSDNGSESNSNQGSTSTYTVQSGDTLSRIANRFGTSVNNLKSLNGLSSDLIITGQTLQVTGSTGSNNSSDNGSESNSNQGSTSTYTVQSGDTLSRIASRFGTSVNNLKSLNGLSSDLIITGQTLQVTGSSSSNGSSNNSSGSNSNQGSTSTYTVQSGDTLSRIANRFGTSVNNLKSMNGLSSDLIITGQTLQVTGSSSSNGSSDNSSESNSNQGSTSTYTVQSGDTLSRIANRFGTSVNNLKSLNGLSSDLIITGQTLQVTGSSSSNESSDNGSESSSNQGSTSTYTVQSGDTLSRIANRFGTSVNNLKSLNGLSSDLIITGQTLQVTGSTSSNGSSDNGSESNSNQGSTSTYTVQSGDTLSRIANRFGTSVNNLKSLNGLSSDLIITGQTLQVSGSTESNNSSDNGSESSSNQGSTSTYTVQSGDTLSRIANRFGTSVNNLKSLNGLSSDLIITGQTLQVTGSTGSNNSSDNGSESNSNQGSTSTYTVQSGDTLSRIASRFGTSVNNLKSMNGLTSDLIITGQTLRVSGSNGSNNGSASSNTNQSTNNSSAIAVNYTVKPGDTLYGIASRYGVSVSDLASANGISNSDHIVTGQTLNIRLNGSANNSGSQNRSSNTYTVQSGDTLSGIASANNTSVSALMSNNNLNSDLIFVGQTLRV